MLTETPDDRIVIVSEFPIATPETLFDYWTKPDLLNKWWPPEAVLTEEKGGSYHFSWPKQNWHLRGIYTDFKRGRDLSFTWKWDHEPVAPVLVRLVFEPFSPKGTKLTLEHGTYPANSEGKKIRDEHIEGWMFFLGQLLEQTSR